MERLASQAVFCYGFTTERAVKRNDKQAATIGIDIGGTKTLVALFDARFEALAEEKFRTVPEKGGVKAFDRALRTAVKRLLAQAAKRGVTVHFVGVGCAGQVDLHEGTLKR